MEVSERQHDSNLATTARIATISIRHSMDNETAEPMSRSPSSTSLSSLHTNVSSATCHTSNTSHNAADFELRKLKLLAFAKWFLKVIQRKSPHMSAHALGIVQDFEKSMDKPFSSFEASSDILQERMCGLVGTNNWKRALDHYEDQLSRRQTKYLGIASSSSNGSHASVFSEMKLKSNDFVSALVTRGRRTASEERRVRVERMHMIFRVLMKYLEVKEPSLYTKAVDAIHQTRQQHKAASDEEVCKFMKQCVKNVAGESHWRKAEAYVSKILLKNAFAIDSRKGEPSFVQNDQWNQPDGSSRVSFPPKDYTSKHLQAQMHPQIHQDDDADSKVQEYFVNICHAFTKRTLDEHTKMFTTAASRLCFLREQTGSVLESDQEWHLDRKRPRLLGVVEECHDNQAEEESCQERVIPEVARRWYDREQSMP